MSNPETELVVRPSIEVIRQLGVPCERVHSGWAKGLKGGRMKLADTGTPDIWSALGWIEGKMPGKEPTPEQLAWHATARRWGVRVAVSEGPEDTGRIVKLWMRTREFERSMGWL